MKRLVLRYLWFAEKHLAHIYFGELMAVSSVQENKGTQVLYGPGFVHSGADRMESTQSVCTDCPHTFGQTEYKVDGALWRTLDLLCSESLSKNTQHRRTFRTCDCSAAQSVIIMWS